MALIHYFKNYVIKDDYNQYQKVMVVAIVKNAFNNHDKNPIINPPNFIPTLNKFALKTFNQLFYDQEISKLLVTSYLFNLPHYYSLKVIIKTINIAFLQAKFSLILDS